MPRRVKDFDRFTDELRERAPSSILIETNRYPRGITTSQWSAVGAIGHYVHGLVYSVRTERKDLVFVEDLFTHFQSNSGFSDAEGRVERLGQLLLTAEERLAVLRPILPMTLIEIGDGRGTAMPQSMIDTMHEHMVLRGITAVVRPTPSE